jgi:hypothetical protein
LSHRGAARRGADAAVSALPRALRAHDTVVTFLTGASSRARRPRALPPPEVLKNTIEPSPDRNAPRRSRRRAPSPAGTKRQSPPSPSASPAKR